MKVIAGKCKIGPVLDEVVSGHQGLMCIQIDVPSPSRVASTAWIRIGRGVAQ